MQEEPTPETTPTSETESSAPEFEAITSKQQLDKMIAAARKADKAKIAELQPKAAKLDELEQAKKTQAEQDAERIAKLESELAGERQARQRDTELRQVLKDKGLTVDDGEFIHGNTREEMEASAERYKTVNAGGKKPGVGGSGLGTKIPMDDKQRAAASLRAWASGNR